MLKKIITGLVAAAVVAGATLAATSSAEAYPNKYPYWKYHPHYNGYYGGYDNGGGAVAAGILGFIGGALLSDLGNRGYYGGGYCEAHFRTYNPVSHTYMGYDGNVHTCYD